MGAPLLSPLLLLLRAEAPPPPAPGVLRGKGRPGVCTSELRGAEILEAEEETKKRGAVRMNECLRGRSGVFKLEGAVPSVPAGVN